MSSPRNMINISMKKSLEVTQLSDRSNNNRVEPDFNEDTYSRNSNDMTLDNKVGDQTFYDQVF